MKQLKSLTMFKLRSLPDPVLSEIRYNLLDNRTLNCLISETTNGKSPKGKQSFVRGFPNPISTKVLK